MSPSGAIDQLPGDVNRSRPILDTSCPEPEPHADRIRPGPSCHSVQSLQSCNRQVRIGCSYKGNLTKAQEHVFEVRSQGRCEFRAEAGARGSKFEPCCRIVFLCEATGLGLEPSWPSSAEPVWQTRPNYPNVAGFAPFTQNRSPKLCHSKLA